jgi:cyclic di-GMP phosphodiesterase
MSAETPIRTVAPNRSAPPVPETPSDACVQSASTAEARNPLRVLVVDDDLAVATLFERLLKPHGYIVRLAHDAESGLDAVRTWQPDLVLLDVMLPGATGFDVCRRLKQDRSTRLTPVIIVTALDERQVRIQGLDSAADDFLTKPFDPHELLVRVRSLGRMKRYTDDLDSAAAIITTLAVMIEARDGHTEGHCHRIGNYATALGRSLGLGDEDLQTLHRGGFLHDIGMLAIPDAVLRKTGTLTPAEYELIKSHTLVGDSLCSNLRSLHAVRPIVRHHHELLDGSGYPDGLSGADIPLVAQIVGLVDVFDAVTTERPYQHAKPTEQAIQVLRDQVRRGWRDGELVDGFAAIVESGRLNSFAENGAAPSRAPAG